MLSKSITGAAILAAITCLAVPADAHMPCRRNAHACQATRDMRARDWALHRPSTPEERAQTRALNHDALAAQTTQAWGPRPNGFGGGLGGYRRAQIQYQRELRAYRNAERRYAMDMQRYGASEPPRGGWDLRGRPGMSALPPPPRRPMTAQDMDNDPFGPTGGAADPRIAAPTPGLDGATTGLTQFNARSSGVAPPRYDDRYGPPPGYYGPPPGY